MRPSLPRRLWRRLVIGRRRREILESYGWYRSMTGGYAHPHAMDYMTARQIRACGPELLEYKMRHGSLAVPPEKSR